MEYRKRLSDWMQHADAAVIDELSALNEAELEERFYTELAFGTAGLRGIIGAGTNRMNNYVVRRATQGLCDYLLTIPGAAARGVVPQLSFAIRHIGCIAGVVITASHNPPAYNGYKVYWEHGGQLGPVQADAVLAAMARVGYFDAAAMPHSKALEQGLLTIIGTEVDEAYYAATATLLLDPALLRERGRELKLVYTPLHGSGNLPVRELLHRVGVENMQVVPEQAAPDSAFPTVQAPNPEDPDAFTLARALADKVGADVILATDPDADRLGVAVREKNGAFTVLTGNQIGCLLLNHILSSLYAQGKLPENALVVKSIVSSRLADAICARYHVQIEDVLTGFRFISEKIDECQRTQSHTFLFGFEESFGFLAGGFSRDKDAICAAMLAAELCVACAARSLTLCDALQEIYETYGYYKEKVKSYTLSGKAGMEKITAAMQALRTEPTPSLGGVQVDYMEDYLARRRTQCSDGAMTPLALPSSDMIRLLLHNGAWVVIRPSGTEPKLKLYIGANAANEHDVDELLETLLFAADTLLSGLLV